MTWTDPRWLLLALAAVALLPGAALLARWRRLQQARIAAAGLWRRWLGGLPATGAGRAALWLFAAALAAAAAAGPRWGEPGPAAAPGLDVVLALDVSASMRCADANPDRLGRAVAVAQQLVARGGLGSVGLVVGAATAQALVPLTADRATVAARLGDAGLDRWVAPGSNLAALLATAGAQLERSASARAVVLLSDGEELEGDAGAVAATLRRRGVAVFTVAVGSREGAPLLRRDPRRGVSYRRDPAGALIRSRAHPDLLARLAGAGGGAVDGNSAAAPRLVWAGLARLARSAQRQDAPARPAPLALAAALVATASFLLWPWRRMTAAALLLPFPLLAATPAAAPTPAAWERALPGYGAVLARRGAAAAARGAWQEARSAYGRALALEPRRPDLRVAWAAAASLCGDGGAEAELAELARDPQVGATAAYDLGTARLLRGDADGAAEALRLAAAADPACAAAWRNLEIALARSGQTGAGRAPADAAGTAQRDHLVAAAARAALQPLIVRAPEAPPAADGRDW